MIQSKSQSHQSKCFIKFIDLLLEMYAHIPYEIRSEMRSLQNTLIHGTSYDLDDYMMTMQQKLDLKKSYQEKILLNKKNEGRIDTQADEIDDKQKNFSYQNHFRSIIADDDTYPQIVIAKPNQNEKPLICSIQEFSNNKINNKTMLNSDGPTQQMALDFGKLNFDGYQKNQCLLFDAENMDKENREKLINNPQVNDQNTLKKNSSYMNFLSIRMPSQSSQRKLKKMNSGKIKEQIMSRSKSKKSITKSCKDLVILNNNDEKNDEKIDNKSQYGLGFQDKQVDENSNVYSKQRKIISLLGDSKEQKKQQEQRISQNNKKIIKNISTKSLNNKVINTSGISNNCQNENGSKNTLKIVRKNICEGNLNKTQKNQSNNPNRSSIKCKNTMLSARQGYQSYIQEKIKRNLTKEDSKECEGEDQQKNKFNQPHIFVDIFKHNIDQMIRIMQNTEIDNQIVSFMGNQCNHSQVQEEKSQNSADIKDQKQFSLTNRASEQNKQNNTRNNQQIFPLQKNKSEDAIGHYEGLQEFKRNNSYKDNTSMTREKILMNFYR